MRSLALTAVNISILQKFFVIVKIRTAAFHIVAFRLLKRVKIFVIILSRLAQQALPLYKFKHDVMVFRDCIFQYFIYRLLLIEKFK